MKPLIQYYDGKYHCSGNQIKGVGETPKKAYDKWVKNVKYWGITISSSSCPNCGNTALAKKRTENLKHCTDCNTVIPWPLDEGQKPVGYTIKDERDG